MTTSRYPRPHFKVRVPRDYTASNFAEETNDKLQTFRRVRAHITADESRLIRMFNVT